MEKENNVSIIEYVFVLFRYTKYIKNLIWLVAYKFGHCMSPNNRIKHDIIAHYICLSDI